MFNRINKTIAIVIFCIFMVLLISIPFIMYNKFLNTPTSKKNKEVQLKVDLGATSNTVIKNLYDVGLVSNKAFSKIYLKKNGLDKKLREGVYVFNTSMKPRDIFDKLINGKVDKGIQNVTIPEGYTIKQIADKLLKAGVVKDKEKFINETKNGKFDYEFLKDIPKDRPSPLEGYLFPDTYDFSKDTNEHEIIDRMLKRFDEVYRKTLKDKTNKSMTPDNIVTLASIVEGEAKLDSERDIIAGVFMNRLKINQKLESCATVQYALELNTGSRKDVLYNKDLQVNSPYNTYKVQGLPAGPICNPGQKSIEAALNPANVDYLYFVAKGDGSHYFTKDYDDFLKFQKNLKH